VVPQHLTWWPDQPKPSLRAVKDQHGSSAIAASHDTLGAYALHCAGNPELLFTDNETNNRRLFGTQNQSPYVKDAINDHVVAGRRGIINPSQTGTKAAAHYQHDIGPGGSAIVQLRLRADANDEAFGPSFDQAFEQREREADRFYQSVVPAGASEDAACVIRQALGGMLWSKQYFFLDTDKWLDEHGVDPMQSASAVVKWEYPWFAAWDLAFHTLALCTVDPEFAKHQLDLLLDQLYLHPTGQIPAYEWNFSDVNPPVQAWAAIFVYRVEQSLHGTSDIAFLKRVFGKLTSNFGWWVNRKDRFGRSLFEGGFLGLDNIGVFDRSAPLPTGGYLEQADGTAWVALFCQNMLEIACELAAHDDTYQDLAVNYAIQFLFIARAMNTVGPDGMWDEEDGFYYDILRLPDGSATRLKVRSLVGCCPCARRRPLTSGSAIAFRG
jgi:hypothetical protein